MAGWSNDELTKIGGAEEVDVAALRGDGTPRKRVTVWLVRHGDGLYVRSAVRGANATWYRGAVETRHGRIWAAGIHKDVTFEAAGSNLNDEIDAEYRDKYRRYAGRILNSCLTPEARSTTLRLVPRSA